VKLVRHMISQPFVTATGAAALVHSTWALGTLFAGQQPEGGWALAGWLVPALLIAFALDVGQIATSTEIRQHGLTVARATTFIVFAGATYYLQWLYIAHHMPALEIAAGVSPIARETAISMRDAALWIIPALLPLSTLLYTFSGGTRQEVATLPTISTEAAPQSTTERPATIQPEPTAGLLKAQESPALPEPMGEILEVDGGFLARYGAWERQYPAKASAERGLAGYIARTNSRPVPSLNGHRAEVESL
jgi:hypothetical protein